jgi:hypothetical protein
MVRIKIIKMKKDEVEKIKEKYAFLDLPLKEFNEYIDKEYAECKRHTKRDKNG